MRCDTKASGTAICLLLLVTSCASAGEMEIRQAVDRGVTYLRGLQRKDGTWCYLGTDPVGRDRQETFGATALAGLALLESGVRAEDPAIVKAAARLRKASLTLNHTYSLSSAIMFFDLLGDPDDVPLIQSMAVRLLAGQNEQGGWTYNCPGLTPEEQAALSRLIPQRNILVGRRRHSSASREEIKRSPDMPKEIRTQFARLSNFVKLGGARHLADNSNTQFAVLALWVARRHNVPVDRCLEEAAARFRRSQTYDGSWGYYYTTAPQAKGTPTMTCAGLIALGLGFGTNLLATLPADRLGRGTESAAMADRSDAIRSGLIYLSRHIGDAGDYQKSEGIPAEFPEPYFLWSLERVGVLYGLERIGKKDWYGWGAEILLQNQNEKGGWQGRKFGANADTCFALLFLRRANVAHDLTVALTGKILDPGEVKLKSDRGEGAQTSASKPSEKPAAKTPPAAPARHEPAPKPARAETVKEPKAAVPPSTLSDGAEEKEAARLAAELTQAPADKQESLIEQLRERKGLAHTEALARAIPQLTGPAKLKARDALAERLARMTAATLREKIRDENPEVRRAAALACAMKEDKTMIADVITLLEDRQRTVFSAAHAALTALTGKDFGPALNANPADRAVAIAKWKEWWKSQSGAK